MKEQKNNTHNIYTHIKNGELKSAIDLLSKSISEIEDGTLLDKLNNAANTYRSLVHYFSLGNEDSQREKFYNSIKDQLMVIANMADSRRKMKDDNSLFYSVMRTLRLHNDSLPSLIKRYTSLSIKLSLAQEADSIPLDWRKDMETLQSHIFESIWTSVNLSEREIEIIQKILLEDSDSDEYNFTLSCLILSALYLSLLQYYDKQKLILLLKVVLTNHSSALQGKAWVYALIVMLKYKSEIQSDKEIGDIISAISEKEDFSNILHESIFNIIRTRDTDKMNKKFKEEFIPDMMRLRPKLERKLKDLDIDMSVGKMEENPEWQEILDKSGLTDKLKELSEMQSAGGDVMMLAFSNMKNFPFFSQIVNWFLPYDSRHTIFFGNGQSDISRKIVSFLTDNKLFCDSDKYSLALAMERIPEQQKNIWLAQFESQFSGIKEEQDTTLTSALTSDVVTEIANCVKDTYRFHRLFNRKEEFNDPFSTNVSFLDLPFVSDYLKDEDVLRLIGEFYFSRSYYTDALPYLLHLGNNSDSTIYQKIGYIYDNHGDLQKALEYYRRAEFAEPTNKWLLKRIATCYRNKGDYSAAAEYYRKLLADDPDNISITMQLGHSLLANDNVIDALQCYYKVEYIDESSITVLRPIAWCEFLIGNYTKSLKYYFKIPENKRKFADHLNAGHAKLASGDITAAIELYGLASNLGDIRQAMIDDKPHLDKAGVNTKLLPLILDAVAYRQ